MKIERRFLGWGPGIHERFVESILDRADRTPIGVELGRTLVVVPGQRAARVMLSTLVSKCEGSAMVPPRFVTPGRIVGALTRVEGDAVSQSAKRVLWMRAIRESDSIGALFPRIPDEDDHRSTSRLAGWCAGLCDDLLGEGMRVRDAIERASGVLVGPERARWDALALLQESYEGLVEEHGVLDERLSWLDAVRAGLWVENTLDRVVLSGVADLPALAREALSGFDEAPVTALVAAPESCRDGFDGLGLVRGESAHRFWRDRRGAIPDARIVFSDGATELARDALAQLAQRHDPVDPGACSIGLADESLLVNLRIAAMRGADARVRSASGVSLGATGPGRLLSLLTSVAREESVRSLVDVALHPDAERVLTDRLREQGFSYDGSLKALLTLRREHMVVHGSDAPESVHTGIKSKSNTLRAEIRKLCGEMILDRGLRPVSGWAEELLSALARVYGDREFDSGNPTSAETVNALERIGSVLHEMRSDPILRAVEMDPDGAMTLVSDRMREIVIPEAQYGDELECLGWLELLHDPAPTCVVVGLDESSVPGSVDHDPLVTGAVRELLGMSTSESRLTRDLYLSEAINASRDAVFMCARVGSTGEPMLVSRVLMNEVGETLARRVQRFEDPSVDEMAPALELTLGASEKDSFRGSLVVGDGYHAPESMSVTDFDAYLRSPMQWYLERVLGLRDEELSPAELDARRVGDLVHGVLERFGEDSALKDSANPSEIRSALLDLLGDESKKRFGSSPPGTVRVQVMLLEHRFGLFAERQAQRRSEGWRIRHTEWKPTEDDDTSIMVDGVPMRLRAKIDRIDVHEESGRWAIIDYKTGSVKDAVSEHVTRAGVKKLQLPLYRHVVRPLAVELGLEGEPMLGYGAIPSDERDGVWSVSHWKPEVLQACDECAWDIVRAVRLLKADDVLEEGRWVPDSGILGFVSGARFDSGGLECAFDDDEEGGAS